MGVAFFTDLVGPESCQEYIALHEKNRFEVAKYWGPTNNFLEMSPMGHHVLTFPSCFRSSVREGVPGGRQTVFIQGQDHHGAANAGSVLPADARLHGEIRRLCASGTISAWNRAWFLNGIL